MIKVAEVTKVIEATLATMPERASGNEANSAVAERLRSLVNADRESTIEALKSYLSFRVPPTRRKPEDAVRESLIWTALDVAEILSLIELRPEIESLVVDVREGKIFLPVHEKSVARYLQRLVL